MAQIHLLLNFGPNASLIVVQIDFKKMALIIDFEGAMFRIGDIEEWVSTIDLVFNYPILAKIAWVFRQNVIALFCLN